MNDDEILALNVDELIKRFKELGCWTYRSSDLDKLIVVSMIAQAVEKIAYAKGVKRGKSIGSHAAYKYFLKQGHWEDEVNYIINDGRYCEVMLSDDQRFYDVDRHCGAKMDAKEGG